MVELILNGETIKWTEPMEYEYKGDKGILTVGPNYKVWFTSLWYEKRDVESYTKEITEGITINISGNINNLKL